MGRALRALLIEASDNDAVALEAELRSGGFDPSLERVADRSALDDALTRATSELALACGPLPLETLAFVRARDPHLPVIVVSGDRGEDAAVEAMLAGSDDYVVRADLRRFARAVERVLALAVERAEQRKAQAQVLTTDRLASVGILAAGVAHEVNNPLAALIANLEMLAQDLTALAAIGKNELAATEGKTREEVAAIHARVAHDRGARFAEQYNELSDVLRDSREAADRMRVVVRDLKTFTRADREEQRPADVERVLESAARMAWNEIRHRARLTRNYTHVPKVDAGEARLGQVFLNLLLNAAQAIPEGQSDRHQIRVSTKVSRRGFVAVEVSDSGSGIPPEVRRRVFEPFFTTKAAGIGTGLGLSISHRIVTSVGGEIEVESEVGQGTTFRVLLPIAGDYDPEPRPAKTAPATKRARLLVVDDDAPVAASLRRLLSGRHDVQVANSGADALALIQGGQQFEVILCDVLMPSMTGMDFFEALSVSHPELAKRIIFVTGGAFTARAVEFLANVSNPRLDKPIEIAELMRLIERIVSTGSA